ncbi:MAG: hypothetical protein D3920_13370 [Candidatus Electrothrix sp. AW2]|nr:hypothetical protein [Candidatus Electrothrix gigas]
MLVMLFLIVDIAALTEDVMIALCLLLRRADLIYCKIDLFSDGVVTLSNILVTSPAVRKGVAVRQGGFFPKERGEQLGNKEVQDSKCCQPGSAPRHFGVFLEILQYIGKLFHSFFCSVV